MNCPNCNSPLRPNQKFCERCGAKIEQPVTNFDNPQQPSAAPTQVYQPEPEDPGARTRVYVPQTEYADKDNPLNNQPNFDVQEPEQPEYAPQQYRQAPRPGEYPPQPSEYPPQPVGYAPQQRQNPYPQPADNGGKPPKKSKTPLIIVIIVLAVLLVGGGIVTAILLLNPNNKKDDTHFQNKLLETTHMKPPLTQQRLFFLYKRNPIIKSSCRFIKKLQAQRLTFTMVFQNFLQRMSR